MAEGGGSLEQQFVYFSKFGDTKSDGKTITLTQIDKWLKQAQVIGKKITTTDTGICFNKFKSKTIDCNTFIKFIDDLAQHKGIPGAELKDKLVSCGLPGTTKTTSTAQYKGAKCAELFVWSVSDCATGKFPRGPLKRSFLSPNISVQQYPVRRSLILTPATSTVKCKNCVTWMNKLFTKMALVLAKLK